MPAIAGSTPSTGPNFRPSSASDERKANARGAAALMDIRSATWAMGAGGIATRAVARRKRQTTPAATRALAVEGDYPDDARGPGLLASRSRPHQQPSQEPQGALPALPHAARPGRASATPPLHAVPAQSARRPVSGSV